MNHWSIYHVCIFTVQKDDRDTNRRIDIDEPITEQERHNVEQLIRLELANNENGGDSNGLHPLVNEVIPLPNPNRSTPSPLLMQEIERYEQEEDTDDEQEPDRRLSNGIDLSRYSNFNDDGLNDNDDDNINYNNLYSTLSYSMLHERNLTLMNENNEQLAQLEQNHLSQLSDLKEDQHEQLTRKRQQIEDINVIRKKRQVVDFKPVNDYLNDRWKDGIKSVVDLGIESARMDMEIHH